MDAGYGAGGRGEAAERYAESRVAAMVVSRGNVVAILIHEHQPSGVYFGYLL